MANKSEKIYGIKESNKHGLAPFCCLNMEGKEVVVNPKNPDHHNSYFPLQNDPHVFRNLECVIANPDEFFPSTSRTERASSYAKKGKVLVQRRRNYYELINSPSKDAYPNYTMTAVVFYGDDGSNYTLTFYDEPGLETATGEK